MEPLVRTVICPNCQESHVHFKHTAESECFDCGFHVGVYNDKRVAADHLRDFRGDDDVIVCNPVRLDPHRWLIAHTRLFLV